MAELTEQQKKNRKQGILKTEEDSAREARRKARERARKKKDNPDGTLRQAFEEGYHTKSK